MNTEFARRYTMRSMYDFHFYIEMITVDIHHTADLNEQIQTIIHGQSLAFDHILSLCELPPHPAHCPKLYH